MGPNCLNGPSQIGTNDDGTWFASCFCGAVALESGTYDECVEALNTHRDAP